MEKKALIILTLVFANYFGYSQKKNLAYWYEWNDSTVFAEGPKPLMKEFGPLSDSLSKANMNKLVYRANGEYYIINSIADYYLWFMDRYPALFDASITEYHDYYLIQYNYGMFEFVNSNYIGKHLPLPFKRKYKKSELAESEKKENVEDEKEDTWARMQESDTFLRRNSNPRRSQNAASPKSAAKPKLKKIGSN